MLQTPLNKLLVKVKSKYTDNISTIGRIASLQHDTTIDPADFVEIRGEIVSVPLKIEDRIDYKGFATDNMKVGDNCIFSYRVIYDFHQIEKEGKILFKNLFEFQGEEYFICDITDLFAIVRDGEIIMMNGYVMVSEYQKSTIILPQHLKKQRGTVKAQILNIGRPLKHLNPITTNQYDYVHFNENKAQKYQINGKKFCILQQSHILGKISE